MSHRMHDAFTYQHQDIRSGAWSDTHRAFFYIVTDTQAEEKNVTCININSLPNSLAQKN